MRGADGAEETKEPDVVAPINSSYYPASHYTKPQIIAIAIATGVDDKGTKNQIYDRLKHANKLPPRGRAEDQQQADQEPPPTQAQATTHKQKDY